MKYSLIGAMASMALAGSIAQARPDLQSDIDAGLFDDIFKPGYVPTFELRDGPICGYDFFGSRADRRVAGHAYGSGGKAYATSKGRSKDARKARAATRRSRK